MPFFKLFIYKYSVAEGVKLVKQNRIKEAMEYYKRALDMDPKYAEGWFHVAEG